MLLFINLNIRKEPDKNRFQYISCYSLSAVRCRLNSPLLFQYISCYSLSTYSALRLATGMRFQYISCYSLSKQRTPVNDYLKSFQYISCYSLSTMECYKELLLDSFNTSHVTLYHKYTEKYAKWPPSFNTSHVTLYLAWSGHSRYPLQRFNTSHVTLYPMISPFTSRICGFQYISCYSLSECRVSITR